MSRIANKFSWLQEQNRKALVCFVTAGDPNYNTSLAIIKSLPKFGADIIEIGMPFTDPMADGPTIQESSLRALKSGQTMAKTISMAKEFRKNDQITPIVLMGYYNPIYAYGVDIFLKTIKDAGVDGLIVVDLPPEEDQELCIPAINHNINFIRLATPTTNKQRLPYILKNASGFIYYVSVAGITGSKTPEVEKVGKAVAEIKANTELPIVVGFGIRDPEQAGEIAEISDGVVVGSAIIEIIKENINVQDSTFNSSNIIKKITDLVSKLSEGVIAK